VTGASAPTRAEVREKLRQLLAGEMTRQEVSKWAHQWVAAKHPDVEDRVVWIALTRLGGADLRAGSDEFLYCEPDFHAWLDEVEDADEPQP
jgi:hypothetical protein